MIKSNKGKVKVRGSIPVLMADLHVIVRVLCDKVLFVDLPEEDARNMIRTAVEDALIPEGEFFARENAKKLKKILNEVFSDEESEGEKE